MKSFLEGRTVLKSQASLSISHGTGFQPLLAENSGGTNGSHAGSHECAALEDGQHPEPHVELVRRDGVIERIIITCACSRRIELECEY